MNDLENALKALEQAALNKACRELISDTTSCVTFFGIELRDVRKLVRFWEKTTGKQYIPGTTMIEV